MLNEEEAFWKIVIKYPSWSVAKCPDDTTKRRLKLKNVHKQDIIFDYDPDFIDTDTLNKLRSKINDHNMDFWGF